MVDRFSTQGIMGSDLYKVIENWNTGFNKPNREYKNREKKRKAEEAKMNQKPRNFPEKTTLMTCKIASLNLCLGITNMYN